MDKSITTSSLKKRVIKMLKNRGSMTVEEIELLEDIVRYLDDKKKDPQETQISTKAQLTTLVIRYLSNPLIGKALFDIIKELVDFFSN